MTSNDFSWLDVRPAKHTGLEGKAQIMRPGAQLGEDRVWWTDGQTVWFRRSKSNPATLERHNKFIAAGDYKFIETQDDVEIYELQETSPFKVKKTLDLNELDLYNVRRQAAIAACKRDYKRFYDIMTYMRERIDAMHRSPGRGDRTPLAETIYAEQTAAVFQSIEMRQGPSMNEINRELQGILQKEKQAASRIITTGS